MLPLEDRELLTQTMVGLNIDPYTTQSLMESFDLAALGMEKDEVTPVQDTAFGDSYTGGYRLATNVNMAHVRIREELLNMAAGLRGMSGSVEEFSNDLERTTEQTQATMARLQTSTDCVASPSFAAGDTCTLPTTDEG
ncbi:hypothetical protein [Nocardioides okcheonensis]|uniref:hypothetical protein n=1 Tax=Nocardioides okcheonensis TaxID=2894081 RepID=UPI001E4CE93E|nr:hypothetical protein [Nocardioides okcheonensis]UFN43865.1 hypothetical protein LN652_17730 [Nocardioides okcheonensis]